MSRIFAAAVAVAVGVASADAQVPQGYPADYAKVIEAAEREGRLVVYSNTDTARGWPAAEGISRSFIRACGSTTSI